MDRRVVWEGWFSVEIPPDWTYTEQDGVISVFEPRKGVGGIQISLARRKKQENPSIDEAVDLAKSFAASRGWMIDDHQIIVRTISKSPAAELKYVEKAQKAFWQVWHILNYSRLAFLTYTCQDEDRDVELSDRMAVVESFRWE